MQNNCGVLMTCEMGEIHGNKMEVVDDTLMSAEMLISGGVRVMDGHCWGPSPMLIQDRARSPWAHSFWMVHLDKDSNIIYDIIFRRRLD